METAVLTSEQERKSLINRLFIFLAGIYFIQGMTKGGASGLFYLPVTFMLQKKLGFDQSQLQYFEQFMLIPWAVKPLYGLLSDLIPIFGYRRKSWYVIAALIGIFCSLYLFLYCDYTEKQLILFMIGQGISFAFADVLCDAVMVEFGKPLGKVDKFQGVQWTSISIASVIAGLGSGLIATYFSYQHTFLLMAVPSLAVLFVSIFYVPEKRYQYRESKKAKSEVVTVIEPGEALIVAIFAVVIAILLLNLNSFYWKMDKLKFAFLISPPLILSSLCFLLRRILNRKIYFCIFFLFWWSFSQKIPNSPLFLYQVVTLGISEMDMGYLQTIGSAGGALGALLFLITSRRKLYWKERFIAETTLTNMLKWSGFIGIATILMNLFLVNYKTIAMVNFCNTFIYLFSNLTILALAAEFCPDEVEGTFFALLMSVINFGTSTASRVSGALFKVFKDKSPENFADNYWAQLLVWFGWPTQHAKPADATCNVFAQYYVLGWLIVISLCAFSLYFWAIRRFGDSIKEKKELKSLDISPISQPNFWIKKIFKKNK